jgi:uncharacterized membrane protein
MPPETPATTAAGSRSKPLVWLGWVVLLTGLAYFVSQKVPRYFVVTPESYGNAWPQVSWLLPHIVAGVLAAVLGPLQFWPKIRRDYLPFHRIAGRVYVVAVLGGSVASLGLSLRMSTANAAYAGGLIGLAVAWLLTTTLAFVAIRRKNLTQHKQWMIRSYVVTFAFVTFRLLDDTLSHRGLVPEHEFYSILAWGCWAVPLLFTEAILQSAEIFRKST